MGIALILARYLTHRDDEGFRTALSACRLVTQGRYFVQSGLFTGRAGMVAALGTGLGPAPNDPDIDLAEQIRGLGWHALPYGGGLAFPGNQLFRLSMDFATGTAGVLFAMSTALRERPVFLPFTEPPGGAGALSTALPAHETARAASLLRVTEGGVTTKMVLLDLQSLEAPTGGGGHGGGGGGGSTLTVLGCASVTPSNLSLVLCH